MTEPTKTQCLSIYVDEQDAKSYRCMKRAGHGTEHLHGDWVWWDEPAIPSAKPEPSEGARRAALLMTGGESKARNVYIHGGLDATGMFGQKGWANADDLAEIIDRETHSAEPVVAANAAETRKKLERWANCCAKSHWEHDCTYRGKFSPDCHDCKVRYLTYEAAYQLGAAHSAEMRKALELGCDVIAGLAGHLTPDQLKAYTIMRAALKGGAL